MKKTISDQIRALKVGEKLVFKGKNEATIRSNASRIRRDSDLRLVFTIRMVDGAPVLWRLG